MRAKYLDAVYWIAANDDTDWLEDDEVPCTPSVAAALVIDIFGETEEQFIKDLRRELKKLGG